MKTICFFNNKGGVGKTTLTCNIASQFALSGKNVLVIDADPQCNATQLILGDEKVLEFYWPDVLESSGVQTLLDVLKPIRSGDSRVITDVTFLAPSNNQFGVSLLPGHPRFSSLDDKLSAAWNNSIGGDLEGLRRTNWCRTFCLAVSGQFDYVFIDIGPSLGSINRSVLLASDYFVTPLGADVFSIVGVRNIADWLRGWFELYQSAIESCDKREPGAVDEFGLRRQPPIASGYVGYTLQQYITKSKQGVRRPTLAFDNILSQIPDQLQQSLGSFLAPHLTVQNAKLGDVPNMYSLIPLAQYYNSPIARLKETGALVGSQFKQSVDYADILYSFATKLAQNMGDTLETSE